MLVKRDILRALKSFHIQVILVITILFSFLFTFFVGNGNKIGISIFGELTTYKDLSEVLLNGLNYTRGLGFLITFAITLFIAEEYQYNTWQHYICSGRKRWEIYVGKYLFANILALIIFLIYILSSYFTSLIINKDISFDKIIFIISRGIMIYATLASLIVFLSMSFKNYIGGILSSLVFVFFEKDIITSILSIFKKLNIDLEFLGKFTLMKINSLGPVANINLLSEMIIPCILITVFSIILGSYCFSKFEL